MKMPLVKSSSLARGSVGASEAGSCRQRPTSWPAGQATSVRARVCASYVRMRLRGSAHLRTGTSSSMADPVEKVKEGASAAAHPVEKAEELADEAARGRSARTPVIAITGVSIVIGVIL